MDIVFLQIIKIGIIYNLYIQLLNVAIYAKFFQIQEDRTMNANDETDQKVYVHSVITALAKEIYNASIEFDISSGVLLSLFSDMREPNPNR